MRTVTFKFAVKFKKIDSQIGYGVLLDTGAVVTHRRCVVVAKFHLSCKNFLSLAILLANAAIHYHWYDIRSGLDGGPLKKSRSGLKRPFEEKVLSGDNISFKRGLQVIN